MQWAMIMLVCIFITQFNLQIELNSTVGALYKQIKLTSNWG